MSDSLQWHIVEEGIRPIGAIGVIDGQVAVIGTFYDDRDGDMDGSVSLLERGGSLLFSNKGRMIAKVAGSAIYMDEIINGLQSSEYDHLVEVSNKFFMAYLTTMTGEAIYATYFKRGIGSVAGAIAARVASKGFKHFIVRRSLEMAVKRAYQEQLPAF